MTLNNPPTFSAFRWVLAIAIAGFSAGTSAQQATGMQVFASDDADDTSVLKIGGFYDFMHEDIEHHRGIAVERAWFKPFGGQKASENRLYYRFADTGTHWKWNGKLGTNGTTWLGHATIHNEAKFRQEYFIERDVVETPMGLEEDLYSTFVGAAYDAPIDDRNILTGFVGVQDFSGDNTRLHLRGRYIRVLSEERGLSAQLRTRYFRSSDPYEYDYFSPRWYAEVIPTLQLRRFRGGWMYVAAAGLGRARDSDSDWRTARLFEASVTSPKSGRDWFFKASLVHSNTPINTGYSYDYNQLMLEFSRTF